MASGILFYIVGASGVGKDTLMSGALERLTETSRFKKARRVITRPPEPTEDHEAVSPEEFERRRDAGDFILWWQAHGLSYGLPSSIAVDLDQGTHVIANGSRAALGDLVDMWTISSS